MCLNSRYFICYFYIWLSYPDCFVWQIGSTAQDLWMLIWSRTTYSLLVLTLWSLCVDPLRWLTSLASPIWTNWATIQTYVLLINMFIYLIGFMKKLLSRAYTFWFFNCKIAVVYLYIYQILKKTTICFLICIVEEVHCLSQQ